MCVCAKSFPEGIQEAYKTLESKVESAKGRKYFGIYQRTEDGINYSAAMLKESDDEDKKYGFDGFTIEKGKYLSVTVKDWQKSVDCIGPTFEKIFEDERVDKNSVSIEVYKGNDMECLAMMKANDEIL